MASNFALQASTFRSFNEMITSPRTQEYLGKVLGEKKSSFVNNLTALVANSSALQACDSQTIMYSALKATALDLPLDQNLGFAYVIPYNNTRMGRVEAQFQLGYKAFVQLAMRSGQFQTINVRDVREGEIIDEDFISGELKFKRAENRETLPVVGYVAYFRLTNGFEKQSYWTIDEIKKHGSKYSKTFGQQSGVWQTNFDAMAQKTVLKLLLAKYAPMSVDMGRALTTDQSVTRAKSDDLNETETSYVDNEPDVVEAQAEVIKTEQQSAVANAMKKQ